MRLQTDPTAFSITALLADQVALVARNQKLPPGAASLLLRELMEDPAGRRRLLRMLESEWRAERDTAEAAKAAHVLAETAAWLSELDSRSAPLADLEEEEEEDTRDPLFRDTPAHRAGPHHLRQTRDRSPAGIAWRRSPSSRTLR